MIRIWKWNIGNEHRKELESNREDYYEIEKMPSRDSFMVMEDHLSIVKGLRLKESSVIAIKISGNPFEISNS